jgi:L-alanine-DL-glutamate epimerase-like enolase superfamily enzyme
VRSRFKPTVRQLQDEEPAQWFEPISRVNPLSGRSCPKTSTGSRSRRFRLLAGSRSSSEAEELKEFRLKWLEEPVWPPENYDGLAQLRKTCGIPIAAGENVSTLLDFERLMAAEAVDFVHPSVAKAGGITELCKVFPIAVVHNVTVMPHTFYDGPGLLAGIHATAALGTTDSMIEWRRFNLEAQLHGDELVPKRGRVSAPQKPGLGIDPDPDVIRAYRRV